MKSSYVVVFGPSPIKIMSLGNEKDTMLSLWIKDDIKEDSAAIFLVEDTEGFEKRVKSSTMTSSLQESESKALLVLNSMLELS